MRRKAKYTLERPYVIGISRAHHGLELWEVPEETENPDAWNRWRVWPVIDVPLVPIFLGRPWTVWWWGLWDR